MDETNKYTVIFKENQLKVLSFVTRSMVVNKIATMDQLDKEREMDLVEARNIIQKSLDFPDLKF